MRRNVRTTYDPNLPSGKKFVAVHVQNEDPLYFLVEVKSKVCELFAQICKFLNLLEPELFGLAIKCSDCFIFLDPLEKMSKYAPKPWKTQNNGMDNEGHPLFNVFFRVQFYVDSYLFISDKVAKLLYYHQMRENVLNYDQSMCEERAFQLASYALQADYGNYNPQLHKLHYFVPSHYFPAWVIEELGVDYIVRNLPALHCDHKGMSRSEAQSMYIKEASDSSAPHNFHFYQLCCKKMHSNNHGGGGGGSNSLSLAASSSINSATSSSSLSSNSNSSMYNVWLAITISGIAIYARDFQTSHSHHHYHFSDPSSQSSTSSQSSSPSPPSSSRLKTRISFFPWSDIGKLSFEKKKFEIRSTGAQGRKFVYYAPGEEISRHLLWFSRASHQFHLMVQTKMKEMLKREAEITRRKYRESCVSTVSCSNSTGSSSSGNSSAGPSNPSASCSSTTTSKSVSPFDLCSTTTGSNSHPSSPASSANSSTNSNHIGTKKMGKVGPAHSHHSHHYHHLLVPKNKIGINQAGTSDLDISNSSSVCGDDPNSEQQRVSVISNASSNTTSGIVSDKLNSCSLEDSDRDDIDSDLLMSLNHPDHHLHHLNHLHHHASVGRTVTLSGCSTKPQPVVSLESLALSEPIDHRNGRSSGVSTPLDDHKLAKSVNLATNKKHSISISNIVITANQSNNSGHSITPPMSSSTSPTKQNLIENSSSKMLFETNVDDVDTDDDNDVDDNEQRYLHESVIPVVPPTPNNKNEVMITGESCSKVLCLNINPKPAIRKSAIAKRNIQESNLDLCCTSSVNDLDDDCSDFDDDDVDSMIFDSSANKSYLSGKSNVTVLSTILKPEAERLLKQGIKADDAELLMIDSKEMAEFKEFEQAEKEKIILNSLINNMPPPPLIRSCNSEDEEDEEDTSSSSSSSSDDDDDDNEDHIMIDCVKVKVPRRKCSSNKTGCDVQGSQATTTIGVTPTSPTKRSCYSPLMQEKSYYHRYTRNGSSSGSSTSSSSSSSSPPLASSNQPKSNPIYENLISPNSAKPNNNNNNCKALLNMQKSCPLYNNLNSEVRNNRESRLPPPAPLRPTPSLNAIGGFSTPTHSHSHQHRTGMRIGVSSLNRPLNSGVNNNNRANLNALLAAGGCYHNQQQMQKSHNLLNETNQNLCCRTNLLDSATAGSEPNLSMMSSSMNYWNTPKLFPAPPLPPPLPKKRDSLLNQKSSSVIDNLDRTGSTFLEQPQQFCSTFRQFIANHQPTGTDKHVNLYDDDDDNDNNEKVSKVLSQDNNNNIENIHCYPGMQHKQQKQLYSDIPHRTTQTQTSCVASQKNNNGGDNLKGNGSITNLHQLRQRSSDLNLPLITALFNDSTLMSMSSKFSQPQQSQPEPQSQNNPAKSQSLQQIPDQVGYNLPVRGNAQNNNHQSGGGGTVERTNTFRVDEAIANGAINRGNPHHSSTPITSNIFQPNQNCRPTSWHLSAENCSSSSNHPHHHFVEQTIWARRENQI